MRYVAIYLIKLYKKIPGKWHHYCKFKPTCSDYAIGVFSEFGFIKGLILSIKRIMKCNPLSKGGYDPIPTNKKRAKVNDLH